MYSLYNCNLLICLHYISLEVNMVFSGRTSLCFFQIKSDFKKITVCISNYLGCSFLYKTVITSLFRFLRLCSARSWEFVAPLFLTIWFIFQILIEFHYICLCSYHLITPRGIFPDSIFFYQTLSKIKVTVLNMKVLHILSYCSCL